MPGVARPKTFIGYRRDDARGSAGRIYDRLADYYGSRSVFRDVDRIASGANFVEAVREAIQVCDVMLVIVGPDWVTIADDGGTRRLDSPDDHVRTEVRLGLEADVRVIPVLVAGAVMPGPAELPEPLRPLAAHNAVEVRETRFDDDLDHLIGEIGGRPRLRYWARTHRLRSAGIVGGAAAAGLVAASLLGGPALSPLTGDFNVAVAQFAAVGGADATTAGNLAATVFANVEEALAGFEESGDLGRLEVAGPEDIGAVDGDTPGERAQAAEELAREISADVVIYGSLESDGGATRFAPEFYLADFGRLDNAEELAGGYALGTVDLPTTNPVAVNREISAMLEGQAAALGDVVVGLSYYSLNDWETAESHFVAAEAAWPAPRGGATNGKEVVLHLLGNVSGEQGPELFEQARRYYEQAVALDPDYARSWSGLAEIAFQLAKGSPCGGNGPTDVAGVEAAIEQYRDAASRPAPPLSYLDVRGRLQVAAAYVCLEVAGEDRQALAEPELRAVVAAFDGESARLRDMAAEAHQLLGLLQVLAGEPAAALVEYQSAIDLSVDRARQASFHAKRGIIYKCYLDEPTSAAAEYEAADALAGSPVPREDCPP